MEQTQKKHKRPGRPRKRNRQARKIHEYHARKKLMQEAAARSETPAPVVEAPLISVAVRNVTPSPVGEAPLISVAERNVTPSPVGDTPLLISSAAAMDFGHLEAVRDFAGFCRLCLTQPGFNNMTQIFSDSDSDAFRTRITSVIPVQVDPGDGLPSAVCANCTEKLVAAQAFIGRSVVIDAWLRNHLHWMTVEQEAMERVEDVDPLGTGFSLPHEPARPVYANDDSTHYDVTSEALKKKRGRPLGQKKKPPGSAKQGRLSKGKPPVGREPAEGEEPAWGAATNGMDVVGAFVQVAVDHDNWGQEVVTISDDDGFDPAADSCQAPFAGGQPFVEDETYDEGTTDLNTFPARTALVETCASQMSDKPFVCFVCAERFARPAALCKHTRKHGTEKQFACGACPKMFAYLSGLRSHEQTHSGERPFACPICQKAFAVRTSLSRHMRMHKDS